jgi:hypothetical protein
LKQRKRGVERNSIIIQKRNNWNVAGPVQKLMAILEDALLKDLNQHAFTWWLLV